MKRLIAAWSSMIERKTPRWRRRVVRVAKKPSTALSQEQEVRREVEDEAPVALQPRLDLRVFVRGAVVEDDVHDLADWHGGLDAAQKPDELDATLLQASVKPPSVKEGTVSERDPEAGWTKKNGKSHFGYKAHLAVDEGSEIIRTAILTSADLHDSQPAAQLIRGDEHAVYGDKAYASQRLRDRLADAGINDGLMYKAARNKPLKPWQTWFNKAVAAIRAAVERRFGIMKRGYGFRRVRYIGLVRNACYLQLLCTAINLKRALALAG